MMSASDDEEPVREGLVFDLRRAVPGLLIGLGLWVVLLMGVWTLWHLWCGS